MVALGSDWPFPSSQDPPDGNASVLTRILWAMCVEKKEKSRTERHREMGAHHTQEKSTQKTSSVDLIASETMNVRGRVAALGFLQNVGIDAALLHS